ncbi:MAG: hypothetical protein L3J59_06790 [Methylococcaceae bacterium]|nr:hypothetical protein [Methylococcaceae bacterium]
MNTLVKITTSILILMTISGCVRHSGYYSDYSDDYYYDRGGYNTYYSNPVYYDRHVYVQPPIYIDRHNSHRTPHYNYSNKPQKPNIKHRYNEYQQSSKPNIKRQIRRNNSRFGESRSINKNNFSNKSNKKPAVNHSFSRPTSGKGTKRNSSRTPSYTSSGKSSKRNNNSNYSRTPSYPSSGKSSKINSRSNYTRPQPTSSSGSKFGKSRNTYSPQRQHSGGKSSKR